MLWRSESLFFFCFCCRTTIVPSFLPSFFRFLYWRLNWNGLAQWYYGGVSCSTHHRLMNRGVRLYAEVLMSFPHLFHIFLAFWSVLMRWFIVCLIRTRTLFLCYQFVSCVICRTYGVTSNILGGLVLGVQVWGGHQTCSLLRSAVSCAHQRACPSVVGSNCALVNFPSCTF